MPVEYVSNARFSESIREYYKRKAEGRENERIPEEIGKFIILIAQRLSTRYNFSGYTYKDEMVSDRYLKSY